MGGGQSIGNGTQKKMTKNKVYEYSFSTPFNSQLANLFYNWDWAVYKVDGKMGLDEVQTYSLLVS